VDAPSTAVLLSFFSSTRASWEAPVPTNFAILSDHCRHVQGRNPRRLSSIGLAIKLYRLPVSSRISQYPWPAQSCPVTPPRRRSLSAAARTCCRQGSGDHLVTAPPPYGSAHRPASIQLTRAPAGVAQRRRPSSLPAGHREPCHISATVVADVGSGPLVSG
jgi:hypothetical protein